MPPRKRGKMEEEKSVFDYTEKDFLVFIKKQREVYVLEEFENLKQILTDRVKRVLDLRDLMKATRTNFKRTRQILNKYAKTMKRESDVKKLLKKQEDEIIMIESRYVASMVDLMMIVIQALGSEGFQKDLTSLETWYEFEMEDFVFVNGIIKSLKDYSSFDITEFEVMDALDAAIEEYINCIENDVDYREKFDKNSMFVCFPEKEENKEQEDKDE